MAHTFIFEAELNRLDALHYYLGEHRRANVAMCMVAVLDRDIEAGIMRDGFATAAAEIPRFKDRLRRVPGGLAPPVWEADPHFDIRSHFRVVQLGSDGDWPAVLELVDALQSQPFAPGRPPWSVLYVRSTPDHTSLVVLKLHHALSDGTALTLMLSKVFMREALGDAAADIHAVRSRAPASVLREAFCHHRRSLGDTVRCTASSVSRVIRKPSELQARSQGIYEYVTGPRRWPVTRHSPARRSAFFRVSLATWRNAARDRGGGVNDLYVAFTAATLRRYLAVTGKASGQLAIVMPIDVRSQNAQQDGGNVTGAGILKLAGSDSELIDLREVNRQSCAAQDAAGGTPPSLVDNMLALCPGPVQSRAIFRRFSTKDALATNVIIPLRCGLHEAQAGEVYILPPVIGTPVSFALAGYGDAVHLAVNMDLGLISEPDLLEKAVVELLAEICGSDAVVAIARGAKRFAAPA